MQFKALRGRIFPKKDGKERTISYEIHAGYNIKSRKGFIRPQFHQNLRNCKIAFGECCAQHILVLYMKELPGYDGLI